jgi:hypothetical protein
MARSGVQFERSPIFEVRMGLPLKHEFALYLLLSATTLACAQTPSPTPAPSPVASDASTETLRAAGAYKAAMRPLDVVRSSMDNWSDAEREALAAGRHMAQQACAQIRPEEMSGDDLYDLARLCSFGQSWTATDNAARRYIASNAEPHRAPAFALSMNAQMQMGKKQLAIETARDMLRMLNYDAEVAYALRFLKTTLEQDAAPELGSLMETEHSHILDALRTGEPLKAVHGEALMSAGALYESGMQEAFYKRISGDDAGAAAAASDYDSALNKNSLPQEDRQQIEKVRAQYRLLGAPLPVITILRSYNEAPSKNTAASKVVIRNGAATILMLFPEWCVQCRRMMKTATAFDTANAGTPIPTYGLVYTDEPDGKGHEQSERDLEGTVALQITPESAAAFHPIDFPLGIILDAAGTVRYVGQLPGDAFDGFIEMAIKRMAAVKTSQTLMAKP